MDMRTRLVRSHLNCLLGLHPNKEDIVREIKGLMDRDVSYKRRGVLVAPSPGWHLHLLKLQYPDIFALEEVRAQEAQYAKNLERARKDCVRRLFSHWRDGTSKRGRKKVRDERLRKRRLVRKQKSKRK